MSLFKPDYTALIKHKNQSHHPWENTIKNVYRSTYKSSHNSANICVYPKENDNTCRQRTNITLIGNRITKEFIYCYYLIKTIYKYNKKQFEPPIIQGVTGVEWPKVWNDLKIRYGTPAYIIQSQVVVLINDKILGGEKELKSIYRTGHFSIDYYKEGIKQLANYINSSGRPCAYLHISVNEKEIGTLLLMLYADIVPRTCENFLRLCTMTKGGYSGTPVHRIVKDSWIQCGGFGLKRNPDLACENFIVPHDRRGVVCMANDGRDVDCSTQFFVLLQPAPWMENKYVAFGQLIEGEKTLSKIESLPTWYESPTKAIIIYKAGIVNMDCEYMPINKNVNEYLQAHIENINELGKLLYEDLLEKVFTAIQSKTKYENEDPAAVKNLHETERFIRKKMQLPVDGDPSTSESIKSSENNEFDVEDYEYEDNYSMQTVPSSVVEPTKSFFLPLEDVPYPGEVNSTYDLKKYLHGNNCYEDDINNETNILLKNQHPDKKILSIPDALINDLFECFFDDNVSRKSSDSEDAQQVRNYIRNNVEKTSFAGAVVKKIANLSKKYEVFDEEKLKWPQTDVLTDEDLRLIRVAIKEYQMHQNKKMVVRLCSSKLSHAKIRRCQTGYIRKEYLLKFYRTDLETFETLEDHTERYLEPVKKVQKHIFNPSVLAPLYKKVSFKNEDQGPTFKSLALQMEISKKRMIASARDSKSLLIKAREKMLESGGCLMAFDHIIQTQRERKSKRKIEYLKEPKKSSILAEKYRHERPWISVEQYKMKNKMYRDQSQSASNRNTANTKRNTGKVWNILYCSYNNITISMKETIQYSFFSIRKLPSK